MFCIYYLSNGYNAKKAAIDAGYSEKTAAEMGYENMKKPHLRAFMKERMDKIFESTGFTTEKAVKLLEKIAHKGIETEDLDASIKAINERNKMEFVYTAEKEKDSSDNVNMQPVKEILDKSRKEF